MFTYSCTSCKMMHEYKQNIPEDKFSSSCYCSTVLDVGLKNPCKIQYCHSKGNDSTVLRFIKLYFVYLYSHARDLIVGFNIIANMLYCL